MADAFTANGAVGEPSDYAPLTMDRYMTGLWTNRSALRDADVPYLQAKFYGGSRYDSFIDGLDMEVSAKLTTIKRPGSTVWNSATWDPINRWYSFLFQLDGVAQIKVIVDCASQVFDGTGPDIKKLLWTKSAGGGKTFFHSVGNTLYFTNGVDRIKWTLSTRTYQPLTAYTPLQFIIDPNNNIQVAVGGTQAPIIGISSSGNIATILLDPNSPQLPINLNALKGINFTFSGLTVATYLNGQTLPIVGTPTESSISVSIAHADFSLVPETGIASSGNGITGTSAVPGWSTTIGGVTLDEGQQWVCKGSSIQNWGLDAPLVAPNRVQTALPNIFPAWSKNTYFSTCFLITDEASFIQKVTGFGTTGSVEPVWNETPGGTTADNTVVWTNQGANARANSTPVTVGKYIESIALDGNSYYFQCITPGVTGAAAPSFNGALGSPTQDGGVVWNNVGISQVWGDITASSVSGNFGFIPLQGGGSIIIGVGTGGSGGAIAYPAGYNAGRSVAWSTPGVSFNGSTQVSGVFQSTTLGGVLGASMQNRSGGLAFNAIQVNWAAAAWSATATVTQSVVGGMSYIEFTTVNGDALCICTGAIASGVSITVPAGFSATQFINIAGMSGTAFTGNGMQGVQTLSLSSSLELTANYTDNAGNTWDGTANIFGIFWNPGGGVSLSSVTGGEAISIVTTPGSVLAIIQANLASGASFGLPTGFGASTVVSTCSAAGFTPSGTDVSHGWSAVMSGQSFTGTYQDGSGHTWGMSANVLAVAAILNTTPISQSQTILDSNGFLEAIERSGVTGAIAPSWAMTEGTQTVDKNAIWANDGSYSIAGTAPTKWGFSYKNFTCGTVSTMSPVSQALTFTAGTSTLISGPTSPDTQSDTIVIFRTEEGGGVFFLEDEIPSPPPGQMWTYNDNNADSFLDIFTEAPINHVNDRPPVGMTCLNFHDSRIWGGVGVNVQWATGPDVTIGNGNEAWSPSNVLGASSTVYRLEPVSITNGGILVFTGREVDCVFGDGTSTNAYFLRTYAANIGLLNYDALDVVGSTFHMFTNARKQVSLDPSAGYDETGFPIGDQFTKVTTGGISAALYDPRTAFVTWHEQNTGDTALFVADGSVGWFRYSPVSSPESGFLWSPRAAIEGGTSAVQSVETEPGVKTLLIGPKTSGPIVMRDTSTNADLAVNYPNPYVSVGNIQLCQPGQIAEVASISLQSLLVGMAPTCGMLYGEIKETAHIKFDMLKRTANEPPDLPASATLYSQRFSTAQNGKCPKALHIQLKIQWSVENAASELLTHTIFGAKHSERTQQ